MTEWVDPPDLMNEQMTLLPGVMFDSSPMGTNFGDVIAEPYPLAYNGETIMAKFVSAIYSNYNK